jgi:hypothetical protein
MAEGTEQATCSRCGVIAILTPIAGGYRHSIGEADVGRCSSNVKQAQGIGLGTQGFGCDCLLDAVSLEYKRLLQP